MRALPSKIRSRIAKFYIPVVYAFGCVTKETYHQGKRSEDYIQAELKAAGLKEYIQAELRVSAHSSDLAAARVPYLERRGTSTSHLSVTQVMMRINLINLTMTLSRTVVSEGCKCCFPHLSLSAVFLYSTANEPP